MMKTMAVVLAAALCGWLAQDEQVDNPEFKTWSKCKVGAYVKYKVVVEHGGQKHELEMTHKLVELTGEKAVIEITNPVMNKTDKMEIPAKVKKADEEGDEDVEAGGKTYKCHWVKYGKDKESKKFWFNDEVPGFVKSETVGAHGSVKTMSEFKTE